MVAPEMTLPRRASYRASSSTMPAAGHIDEQRGGLHERQFRLADEPGGGFVEGAMHAHDVRLGEQLVQFPALDAVLGGKGFGPAGIGPEEAGFEPGHPGSHAAPDVAEADDAHGLAADFTAHGPGLSHCPVRTALSHCGTLRR